MSVYRSRRARLRKQLQDEGLACAVIMPGPNLRYLTGLQMHSSERM
ncbi:MAG TPA: aminopeptidase P family protein, partial [Candidatus Fraserbacteria bacterium]|nr:aminopeptidase P family protein [Candidatus Fraserbacteria bacterium]